MFSQNADNVIVETLATAFIAYAIAMLSQNFTVAVVAAIIGVAGKVLYQYLP